MEQDAYGTLIGGGVAGTALLLLLVFIRDHFRRVERIFLRQTKAIERLSVRLAIHLGLRIEPEESQDQEDERDENNGSRRDVRSRTRTPPKGIPR